MTVEDKDLQKPVGPQGEDAPASQPLQESAQEDKAPEEAAPSEPEKAADAPPGQEKGGDVPGPEETDQELEEFDSLIDSYLDSMVQHELDAFVTVSVVKITDDSVLVDMGDKAEGVILADEFKDSKGRIKIAEGDQVEVQILGRDEETGLIEVSYQQAKVRQAWGRIEEAYKTKKPISGEICRVVKSGVLVDVGLQCFMPASQISDRRVNNLEEWLDKEVDAYVIDLNPHKKRAVLSRRRLVEEQKREALAEKLEAIQEDTVEKGTVKSILNFGAFISFKDVDAFMPREEISWEKALRPEDILKVGDEVEVKVLSVDKETGRIRVSRKILKPDPWAAVLEKYPVDSTVTGEVVSITRYGAFVRLEEGLTGLIHASDLSWAKGPQKVTDHVKEGDRVDAVVLSVDTEKQRMGLGLKQLVEDPWEEAEKQFPRGSRVKGKVSNLAPFGAFIKLADGIEGMIHVSDLTWEGNVKHPGEVLKAGDEVEAVVLKSDLKARRISLGLKQLSESPQETYVRAHPVGTVVEAEVVRMISAGAFFKLAPKLDGFMPVSQIDVERVEKPEDLFSVGEMVKCRVARIEKHRGDYKITLSRKDLIQAEQRKAIREFEAKPNEKGGLNLGELMGDIKLDKPE